MKLTIYPVEGRSVRDPATRLTVIEPIEVDPSSFWERRIGDGDVTLSKPAASAKEKAK